MRLTPCSACARHVRVDADACPFCAAPRAPAVPPGGASSAIKVGALLLGAVAMTGCPRAATKYGGPPLPERPPEASSSEPGSSDPNGPGEPVELEVTGEPEEPGEPAAE